MVANDRYFYCLQTLFKTFLSKINCLIAIWKKHQKRRFSRFWLFITRSNASVFSCTQRGSYHKASTDIIRVVWFSDRLVHGFSYTDWTTSLFSPCWCSSNAACYIYYWNHLLGCSLDRNGASTSYTTSI